MTNTHRISRLLGALLCAAGLSAASTAGAAETPIDLPTGQQITPTAATGSIFEPLSPGLASNPGYVADGAAAIAVSPDGRTMLVLTSGYNKVNGENGKAVPDLSQQYVIVYDISGGKPARVQTLTIPNSFSGIVWQGDGKRFFVAGGVDDVVHVFAQGKSGFEPQGKPIPLGHKAGLGVDVKPQAAGLAVNARGDRLLVANYYNDSVSLIDLKRRRVIAERDLRPGRNVPSQKGIPGGEFPFAVIWKDAGKAYVSAARDREIVVLSVKRSSLTVKKRIRTVGAPTSLLLDRASGKLYAVEDNADHLAVIDTARDEILHDVRLGLPEMLTTEKFGKGLNPNSLAFGPGKDTLLVTMGGINALAVVDTDAGAPRTVGLVPTGWYPSAAATGLDGRMLYVVNRKSPPGANPMACGPNFAADRKAPRACSSANQYIFQLEKAGLLSFPLPDPAALGELTQQTGRNIGLMRGTESAKALETMAALRSKIKHVIFIIKENRTYDQVLGDLEIGNGDPKLAILGEALTPNHHDLARKFVTFDNFHDSGEQSSTGWTWSTAARVTDILEKTAPVNYAGRGLSYEAEGGSRNMNMAASKDDRRKWHPETPDDDDLLPGTGHVTSPDAEEDGLEGQGFLWNAAIRAGLSVRNYGFANDFIYEGDGPNAVPLTREPAKTGQAVYVASDTALASRSDPYFRGYDQKFPDYWRVQEWMREFDLHNEAGTVPALSLVRISHDHFGEFDKAVDGVNTVETQMADNDYALGLIVEKVANSKVADETLIFVIEDDAQGGADHVDARRSIVFIAGPYVKKRELVSTRYTTVNVLRTIEDVLGLKPMGLNDALALPMADAFDLDEDDWTFRARVPQVLRTTQLPLPPERSADGPMMLCPVRSAAYWSKAMRGQNFALEDRLDTEAFNAALWTGLRGHEAPAPTRHGRDMREGRASLLARPAACARS